MEIKNKHIIKKIRKRGGGRREGRKMDGSVVPWSM